MPRRIAFGQNQSPFASPVLASTSGGLGLPGAVRNFLTSLGIMTGSAAATPTYTGAAAGSRFVPNKDGVLVAQAGLTNPLGQAIPPVAGGNIAAGPTLISGGSNEALVLSAARTNKVTARKRNPTDTTNVVVAGGGSTPATVSVVSDQSALEAAGLGTICNTFKVYKVDNSLGDASATCSFDGTTGNTNPHSGHFYARCSSGSVYIRFAASNQGAAYTGATYSKLSFNAVTPGATTNSLSSLITAGGVAYIILPGLFEANSAPYYPVVDSADNLAAVTLAASDLSYPIASLPALSLPNGFQWRARFTPRALPGTDQWILSDATSGAGLYVRGSDNKVVWRGASLGADVLGGAGSFTSWTGDNPDGFTLAGTEDANNYVTQAGPTGKCRIVSNGTFIGISKPSSTTVGKVYEYSFNISALTGGVKITSGAVEIAFSTTGVKTGRFVAGGTGVAIVRSGSCDATIDDFTVVEVKEIATAALTGVGTMQRIGIKQTPTGASISLDGTVTTDATMTTMPTFGTTLSVGEKGNNTLYLTGEFNKTTDDKFMEFRDTADSVWFQSNTF